MVLDVSYSADSGTDSDSDDGDASALSPGLLGSSLRSPPSFGNPGTPTPLKKLHIAHLLQMVLQDAQTKLFFKAQAVMQFEIRYYTPQGDDLSYPSLLIGEVVVVVNFLCV